MENAEDRGRLKVNRAVLFTLLMLALICGLGFAYLGRPAFDRNQHFAAGAEALSKRQPVKKEEMLSQAGVLSPRFDVTSVDDKGTLVAAGRSEAGWTIQLKSGSRILGETRVDENNEWVLTSEPSLSPGEHALSLIAIDPSGKRSVAGERDGRVTVPPRRETALATKTPAEVLQTSRRADAAFAESTPSHPVGQDAGKEGCASAVVKTGDTLWSIAHHCYGDGTKYTKIFRSNRSLIRRPELIYPDQRFAVPH